MKVAAANAIAQLAREDVPDEVVAHGWRKTSLWRLHYSIHI